MTDSKKKVNIVKLLNDNRAWILVILFFIVGCVVEGMGKHFWTFFNMKGIFDSTVLYAMVGLGFSICMVEGNMDLSVGMMANAAAVLVMGLHVNSGWNWVPAILVTLVFAVLVGFVNGIICTKGHIHSFIVTLGMQFILEGGMFTYTGGGSISASDIIPFGDFLNGLDWPRNMFLTPKFLVILLIVIIIALLMRYTRWGRDIYLIGGNPEAAWLAGVKRDQNTISVFIVSAVCCGIGGMIFAITQGVALSNMGSQGISPLMIGLSATVIGGVSIYGGKGSIWLTYVATFGLMLMQNVLTSITGKFETVILFDGIVLALCVFIETVSNYSASKKIGIRSALLEELGLKGSKS
jgi:ribose/xylose/arabinose/galactoside ABC-type transport system permease subunit